MRYENLQIDFMDRDFLDFTDGVHKGSVILCSTDELVGITNKIRKEQGNEDLVGTEHDNDVYYNFYLMFDTIGKTIVIQATCNNGEKDDYVWYKLPMTKEEERNVMFKLVEGLLTKIYYKRIYYK